MTEEPTDSKGSVGGEKASPAKPAKAKKQQRPFPAVPIDEALTFAHEIYKLGSGQSVRRLTLFDHLGKAPDSGASRMLVTNANVRRQVF